jgi:hypothetical protein
LAYHAHARDRLLGSEQHASRNTALHVAAASKHATGRAAMVSFLIAERADVNQANNKGFAAQRGSERGGRADARIAPCRSPEIDQRSLCSRSLIEISGSVVMVAGTPRCTVRR